MAAWVKQIASQVAKHGAKNASWYAFWDEPDGSRRKKSCGPGRKGKKLAEEKADQINAQLTLGTYERDKGNRTTWEEFRDLYRRHGLLSLNRTAGTVADSLESLDKFSDLAGLAEKTVDAVSQARLDTFIEKRAAEPGKKPGSKVSPATVNKDLRHIKAALRWGFKRGFFKALPQVDFQREPERLKQYVTPEHFADLYANCSAARLPDEGHFKPEDWWQALLMFCQMTGWRIGEILALQWVDVDLDKGHALTRAKDNKGRRDALVPLHPVVIEHIRPLKTFHPSVFPWEHHRRTLDVEFARIQDAAGINLPCPVTGRLKGDEPRPGDAHECTDACHRYGFHDERRAFATLNLGLEGPVLQALMRHKSYQTTLRYINAARSLNPAVASLHVPAVKAGAAVG
jgi:integrase